MCACENVLNSMKCQIAIETQLPGDILHLVCFAGGVRRQKMAEFFYYLTIFIVKVVILFFALVAIAVSLIVSAPYLLLWPTPDGMTWGQGVQTRSLRVIKFVWIVVEVAHAAIGTPA